MMHPCMDVYGISIPIYHLYTINNHLCHVDKYAVRPMDPSWVSDVAK